MAVERYNLTFNRQMADQPVIYNVGRRFNLVTIIERANISEEAGWVRLALDGEPEEIQRAIAYLNTVGVFITPTELAVLA